MSKRILFFLHACALTLVVSAQAQTITDGIEPKTKLEAFASKTGAVIIKGFSRVGQLKGDNGTSVMVEVREVVNASSGEKEYGIAIKVTGSQEVTHTSYVDYEEIESLIAGIDYISRIDRSITELDGFQADFRTAADLTISTYTSPGNILLTTFSVQSGRTGGQVASFNHSDAEKMKTLVLEAKLIIDQIR